MSAHDRIETVRTMAESIVKIDSIDVPFIEVPETEPPEIGDPADVNQEELDRKMDEHMEKVRFEISDETVDDIGIDGVDEWWDAWCEVRDIVEEAFECDVEGGDSAILFEHEQNADMRVRNEVISLSISVYPGEVHYVAEYALDVESDQWGMLFEGFSEEISQIQLGREVARAELAIITNVTRSPAETLDYWQTEFGYTGWTQKRWADVRGVGRQTVNDRVRSAVESLGS